MPCELRLAEAAAVLSLATDLAMGQPLERGLRTAVLGVRLTQRCSLLHREFPDCMTADGMPSVQTQGGNRAPQGGNRAAR